MTNFSLREIEAYFDGRGLRYRKWGENRLTTGLASPVPFYSVGINTEIVADKHWITARAILRGAVQAPTHAAIVGYATNLNARLRIVRVALSDGRVVIQAEVPKMRCSLNLALETLSAVLRYATDCVLEFAVLSDNKPIADAFAVLQLRAHCGGDAIESDPDFDFDVTVNRLNA